MSATSASKPIYSLTKYDPYMIYRITCEIIDHQTSPGDDAIHTR